jgi:hypothetical protein
MFKAMLIINVGPISLHLFVQIDGWLSVQFCQQPPMNLIEIFLKNRNRMKEIIAFMVIPSMKVRIM